MVSVFKGNGDGTFGAAKVTQTAGLPIQLIVDDFDGDTNLDVAMACESDQVAVHLGALPHRPIG